MAKSRTMRFEVPFTMPEPDLANGEVGIAEAVARNGRHSFEMDITVLDTPDHRLLRAGIVLAHRVVDGLGEWFLDAPGWAPWLPTNRTEELGAAGDLPQEFASLVRPFRRRSALGPVAALGCLRTQWQLRDAAGEVLATLRDDRLTIRRGGVTTARYREITVRQGDAGLAREQRAFVIEAMLAAGGARVDHFPSLVERIGAPATGLSDFRGPMELDDDASLESFVSWMFARRLDRLMRADLALRSGQSDDMDELRQQLAELRGEVRSLAFALEPEWCSALEHDIDVVLGGLAQRTVHQLGDEYFAVLDALVMAVRAPKLGDLSQEPALEVLRRQAFSGATILFDRARSLTLGSSDERWAATLASAQQMSAVAHTNLMFFGKRARRVEQALGETIDLLRAAQIPPGLEEPRIDLGWDVVTAFQEGRHFERGRQDRMAARRRFVAAWPALEERLKAVRGKTAKGKKK